MSEDAKKLATDTVAIIKSGFHPFKCPIVNQEGKTVECKGGDHLDDGQIRSMLWFIKGVDATLPGK